MMMRMHDITPEAAAESRSILESELDWLDNTLADNRRYLAGSAELRQSIGLFCATPRCRSIMRYLFPALSVPTSSAGAIGR
jgi:hypothetical protein